MEMSCAREVYHYLEHLPGKIHVVFSRGARDCFRFWHSASSPRFHRSLSRIRKEKRNENASPLACHVGVARRPVSEPAPSSHGGHGSTDDHSLLRAPRRNADQAEFHS